ncbi:MAG TPA: hypothetical protein DEF00_02985 [Candidatus Taylorbacteria bacterium]|nr:MAG: Large low complexity coiled coil protein with large repeat region [Parcubacteria group bacterium GW2011_GWA2_47_64]KKU96795.1 MAG: Large low complexity coiled coil protein with large repeat region [Parcubacteria group bacterium GW2011_GWC2_48_17]HBV01330.1 hypothetical protein [Candidatus Taylorbacteria bacterium]
MPFQKNKKPHIVIGVAAMVLSGIFAGIIVGPIFLFAQEPVTEGTTLPADPNTESGVPPEEARGYNQSGVWGVPTPEEQRAAQTGEFGTPEEEARRNEAAAIAAAADKKRAAEELAEKFKCWGPIGGFNITGCMAMLMDKVMWLAARTLWIAGVLLNITLHYTLNLNTLLEKLPIVDIGWKVLRDLANIVFIFITLWCGISITLGIGDGGKKAWGYLAQMVLVALFINFSLFITKAVVDASNIAALHFYSLIVEPGKESNYDSGLSEAFMYGLKLGTLYNSKQLGAGGNIDADKLFIGGALASAGQGPTFTNIILIGFFGSLFIIVTAWVFFAAAIMFIYRAVTLIMLMILSPLAFVGLILPGASGMAHAWWSKLWSQAFFAPLYLALAYVVVKTLNSDAFQEAYANTNTAGAGFAAALTGTGPDTVYIIFNFVILIGLMVACLMVAQSLGAKGSDMAMAGWQKIKGVAVGGVVGVTGAAARGIIKVPSAGIQAMGNVGKLAQRIGNIGFMKDTKFGKKMNDFGTRFQSTEGIGAKMRKITGKAEWLDPRYIEERAGQSKLGNTMIGRAIRGVTTSALANVKIGDKSLQEAHEEGEEMASRRREIEYGHKARQNANQLEPLHEKEKKLLDEKLTKETQQKIAEEKLKEGQASKDPAKIAKAEEALGAGFLKTSEALAAAEENLEKAKKSGGPTTAEEAAVKTAQQAVEAERVKGGAAVETAKAEKDIEEFEAKSRKIMEQHADAVRVALARMSTEAFLELPKTFFENPAFMDNTVLGEDKYLALMKSEHFTREEKEGYTKARWKRAKDTAARRKTRSESFLAEMPEYQKKVKEREAAEKRVAEGLEKFVEGLQDELAEADHVVADAKRDLETAEQDLASARGTANIQAARDLVQDQKDILKPKEDARAKFDKDIATKRMNLEKKETGILRDASGEEIKLKAPKQPGWDEAPDIRKALRNILRPDEVINLYRYDREAFGNPFIADTIKQGTWNEVRRSGQVDSNSIEQVARVQKRHYLKDSLYFGSGLDPVEMHTLEEENLSEAYGVLNELGDEMKKLGIEGYRKWIENGGLQKFLQDKGLEKRLSADIKVQLERHDAGLGMYKMTAPNLASNEFEMMPGMLREHPISLNYYDQASIAPFTHRDIENTLPIAEFYIEQFKRDVEEGGGVISEGNLRILKWFVNENQGQSFTQFEMVREDLKDWFEMIKRLIGKSGRAMTTNKYATSNDVYADMERRTGKPAHDPFEKIRSKTDKPS